MGRNDGTIGESEKRNRLLRVRIADYGCRAKKGVGNWTCRSMVDWGNLKAIHNPSNVMGKQYINTGAAIASGGKENRVDWMRRGRVLNATGGTRHFNFQVA